VINRHNRLSTAIRAELKLWRLPVLTVRNRAYTPVENLFTDLIQANFWIFVLAGRKSKGAFLWENPNPDSCIQKRILRFFT